MKRCTQCFYAKRTTISTFDPAWTCLHPLSRSAVGYALTCNDARGADKFCGIEAAGFHPMTAGPRSELTFRQ